jgi:competence ComEA-like helix-hairpin-helix protein
MSSANRIRDVLYIFTALLITGLAWALETHQPRPDSLEPLVAPHSMTAAQKLVVGRRISLNTASARDLELLPGIGPKTAEKIISWREHHGWFSSPEDLLRVKGVGPKTLEAVNSMIQWNELR